ncbi:Tip elongation aberrant protein 1 [Podospora australis]|uniref:Tip elongation aberrant protein 1 n=1 Tax=Podospora australis TaxID=1536484 RepID=A0AAN6X3Z8_9PEZI|nr:Tip elongation aberrant protein 1 [Podospora australis]
MADPARASSRDKPPQSPHKIKVVRSQKISQVSSPTDGRPPPPPPLPSSSDHYGAGQVYDRPPPIPRSHTPGHLASKSQDRRTRTTDLPLRQRSQSAAASPTATITPSTSTTSTASFNIPPPTKPQTPAPSSRYQQQYHHHQQQPATIAENEDVIGTTLAPGRERGDSAGSGRESASGSTAGSTSTGRRPTALRSTSAIAGRPSGSSGAPAPGAVTRVGTGRGQPAKGASVHTSFPPLADPRTAPDVLAAPSSGMYWSKAPVSGAPHTALRAHTTTLVGSNVYVFGGCDSRACFNELYVLDADAFHWSTPHVAGDIPVPLRAMTCTAVGKKLVIFGGGDGPAYYNDVYVLDTVNFRWSKPRILGDKMPSKRRAHTACLYKNGIYVFGGGDGVRALNDIWRLDVSDITKMSWKLVSSPSPSAEGKSPNPNGSTGTSGRDHRPKARGYHTANMVGSKLIIYGGSDGGECFNDVWVYDVETHTWKNVNIPVTYRRLSHTATIVGSYLFVIGGHDGNEYSNDVLLLNLVTMSWDRRKVYGLPPSGRGYHGTILHDSRLLMIGGFDGSEVFGDVWILELAVHAYYSQISHFTIEV